MSTYIDPVHPHRNSGYEDAPAPVREFLRYATTIRGLSPRTVNAYYIDLRTFFKFLKLHRGLVPSDAVFSDIDISDISLEAIRQIDKAEVYEYLYYMTTERNNSAAARARKLSSLKSFFKYLTSKTSQLQHNPVDDIEAPAQKKRLPKYLSLDESVSLLNNTQSDFTERDLCMLTLFLNCGMRLIELVTIDITDLKDDTLRVIGKGNKERIVYLNSACLAALAHYLPERAAIVTGLPEKALFISRKTKRRLSARRVQQLVTASLKAAGLDGKGYSTHKLRHTAATLMYQYGHVDMLALKEILGHADVSTTQIYTHLDTSQLREAAASSPLSSPKIVEQAARKTKSIVENPVETVENTEKQEDGN